MTAPNNGGNAVALLDKLIDDNVEKREVFIALRAYLMTRPTDDAVNGDRFAALMSFVTRFLVLSPGAVDLFARQMDMVATQLLEPQPVGRPS